MIVVLKNGTVHIHYSGDEYFLTASEAILSIQNLNILPLLVWYEYLSSDNILLCRTKQKYLKSEKPEGESVETCVKVPIDRDK